MSGSGISQLNGTEGSRRGSVDANGNHAAGVGVGGSGDRSQETHVDASATTTTARGPLDTKRSGGVSSQNLTINTRTQSGISSVTVTGEQLTGTGEASTSDVSGRTREGSQNHVGIGASDGFGRGSQLNHTSGGCSGVSTCDRSNTQDGPNSGGTEDVITNVHACDGRTTGRSVRSRSGGDNQVVVIDCGRRGRNRRTGGKASGDTSGCCVSNIASGSVERTCQNQTVGILSYGIDLVLQALTGSSGQGLVGKGAGSSIIQLHGSGLRGRRRLDRNSGGSGGSGDQQGHANGDASNRTSAHDGGDAARGIHRQSGIGVSASDDTTRSKSDSATASDGSTSQTEASGYCRHCAATATTRRADYAKGTNGKSRPEHQGAKRTLQVVGRDGVER